MKREAVIAGLASEGMALLSRKSRSGFKPLCVTAELDIYEKFFDLRDSRSRLDIYEKFSSDDDDFSESGPHDGCNDGSGGIL